MTRAARACLAGLLLALPAMASAHSPIEGINDFYNGLLHPVLVPAHALLLIALGVCCGQRRLVECRSALFAFAVATVTGLLVAGTADGRLLQTAQLATAAVVGLLVAAQARLPLPWRAVLAGFCALLVALDSPPELPGGWPRFLTLLGTCIGMHLLFLYAMGIADYLQKKHWQQVSVRVVGSWVAASAIMVIALNVSTHVS